MDFFQRLGNWFGGKGWINDEEKRRKEQQSTPVAPQAPQPTKAVQFNQPKPLQQPSLLQNRQGFERQLQPKPLQTASQVANTTAMETQRHPQLQWDAPKPKPNPVTNPYRQSQDMLKAPAQKQMESITQRQAQDSQEDAQFRQTLTTKAMANRNGRTDQQIHEAVDRAVQANRQARAAQRTAEASKRMADFVGAVTAPARAVRSMVYKPVERALEGYEKAVDSTDKEAGHQWTSLGDYLRFIAKLPSGMVRGVTGGGEKIGQAITGYKINQDDTTQKINNAQRAGYLIDGLIDTAGVLTGGSGTAVRSLTKQGLKQAASRSGRQIVGHIAKDAGKEGLEELVQHGAGDLADDGKINNDLRSYRDAFLLGGLGGGVMSGAGHGVQAVRNAYRGRGDTSTQNNPYREADKASAKLADLERDAARQMQFDRHNASLPLKDAEFNYGAVQRLAKGLEHGTAEDIAFIRMRPELLEEVNAIRASYGMRPLKTNEVTAFKGAVNGHLHNRVSEGMTPNAVAYTAADALINPESKALPGTKSRDGYDRSHIQMAVSPEGRKYNTATIAGFNDQVSLKNVVPRSEAELKNALQQRKDILSTQGGETGAVPPSTMVTNDPAGGVSFSARQSGDGVNIAKTGENVNIDLHQAYRQHGSAFYDHLTDEQQLRYETMLDDAPRDAQGRYTDPITGETWIDEVVDYDGKKAVRTEYRAADINDRMKIREDILAKFGGKPISLNEIHEEAGITQKSAGKLAGKSYSEQPLDHVNAKINSAMHIDELGLTMTNVRVEGNTKNSQKNAPQYIKGDTIIINDGRAYEATFVIKHHLDGRNIIYDVVIQKEIAAPHAPMRNSAPEPPVPHPGSQSEQQRVNSGDPELNVAKTGENVNIDTPKVGEMPRLTEHAQDVRDFYFEEYKDKGADAMRRDLIESIWSENKKGQGVDFIQTPGEYYGGKRVSNNNPFYAGFYEEYGRKPTKQEITAIVDDALGVENELGRIVLPRDAMEYITENYFGDVDGLRAAREQIAAYGQQVAKESQAQGRQSAELARDVSPEEVNMYIDDQLKAQAHAQKPSMRDRLRGLKQRVRHFLVDDAVAYEDYMQRGDMSKQEFERQKMEHRENIDRVRSSDMIAEQFIRDNGLSELGKMSDHEADEFQQYLIAKRHVEDLAGRGIATGRDYAIDKAIVERFAEKYTAQEKAFRDFNHKLLDYMVDNNLITAENRDILVANNPNYAPFKRLMEDTERFTGNSKELANLRNESVIRKIKGSEKTVLNPVESLMENTLRVVNEAERNQAAMRIAQGVFPESRLTDGVQPRPGYDTVNFLENGQQVRYEVPEMVAREMKNLNNAMPDAAQFIVKVLSMPTKTLRAGATGANPLFAISNLVRDQGQVALTGDLGTMRRGTWPALQALFSPTEKGRALRAELRRNGIIGSEYRQTYGYKHGELVKELQKEYGLKHPIIKTVDKLKHPIDTISDIIGVTEYFTRAQQYFGTEGDAVMKAQAARNNTLNFSRAGASVRILNKIIPFLNAGVQGGRITYNTFRKRPVRTTVATAAVLGVAAAVKGINSSDEQRKEVWDRIADSDKKTNLIVLAPDARYNPESGRVEGVVKIPMPQMLYPVLDAVNNTQGKPEDFLRLGGNIFTMFSGIDTENPVNQLTPTAAKPFIEAALNRNSFTNKELVREYDKNKAPEDKGAMFTSGFARDMARLTGADAPVIDNFIQNWFGGLGKDAAKVMTDNPDNKRDGGGVGRYLNEGVGRRFLSATAKSEAMIGDEQATVIKERIRRSAEFQRLSPDQQAKILNKVDADFAAIAKTKVQVAKGEETKGINNRQQSLESGDLDISEYADDALLTREERSGARKKHLREVYHAEYDEFKKKYDKNVTSGAYTRMEALQAERKLQKLAAGKDIPKEVRDAYAGNKSDVWAMLNQIENEGERAKAAKEILDYGDKLVAAGVEKKNKFRDKYGNIAFAPHEGGSGGGRRGGGRGRSDGATVAARSNEASKVANAAAITLSSVAKNRPQLRSVQFTGRAADLRQFMRGRNAGKPRKSRAVTFY